MKKISFVIITWNGWTLLRDCLESMGDLLQRDDVEVVVADNGSSDGTVKLLQKNYHNVIVVELPKNMGVAYARNRALEKASGDFLFIIDNDIILNDEAVNGMLDFMETHKEVGLCGCQLVDADGKVQPSCKHYPGIGQKMANFRKSDGYHYSYDRATMATPFEPDYLIGACQLVRREAFEEVGLLDEKIFYGPEDADFCLRMRRKGWKLVYLPQFRIIHHCQRITSRRILSPIGRKHIRGLIYFYCKHKRFI